MIKPEGLTKKRFRKLSAGNTCQNKKFEATMAYLRIYRNFFWKVPEGLHSTIQRFCIVYQQIKRKAERWKMFSGKPFYSFLCGFIGLFRKIREQDTAKQRKNRIQKRKLKNSNRKKDSIKLQKHKHLPKQT